MLSRKSGWRDIREDALYAREGGELVRIETQADAKQLRLGEEIFDRDGNPIGVVGFALKHEVFVGKPVNGEESSCEGESPCQSLK